jgi:hypothetical protein
MLDEFIKVVYGHSAEQERITKLAQDMTSLPTSELKKIARFGLSCCKGDEDENWLDKYKGTPLFDQAMALEQQDLEMEMGSVQSDLTRQQMFHTEDQMRAQKDALRIRRRMLDLELAKAEQDGMGGVPVGMEAQVPQEAMPAEAPVEAAPEEVPPEMPAEKVAEYRLKFASAAAKVMVHNDMEKEALSVGLLGRGIARAYRKGGLGAAAKRTGQIASAAGGRAAKWVGRNPWQAAGIGAGVGAAGLGTGYLAGR